jgi:hypothetical protein
MEMPGDCGVVLQKLLQLILGNKEMGLIILASYR